MSRMFTPKQVAEQLAVSPRTVYLWIEDGRLPAIRLSDRVTRIPAEELEAFVERAAGVRPGSGRRVGPQQSVPLPHVAEAPVAYGNSPAIMRRSRHDIACPRCGTEIDLSDTRTATERLRSLLASKKSEILTLAAKHGVRNVRVFGSVARGDARPGSDIDFLVDLEPGVSIFDLSGFEFELADALDWEVDVATEASLKSDVRARALDESTPL